MALQGNGAGTASDPMFDVSRIHDVLRAVDRDHNLRLCLLRNARFEELEIGSHGAPLDSCWLRLLPWGIAAGFGDLQPFDPSPSELETVAVVDAVLDGLIVRGLRGAPFNDEERAACRAVANRIEEFSTHRVTNHPKKDHGR